MRNPKQMAHTAWTNAPKLKMCFAWIRCPHAPNNGAAINAAKYVIPNTNPYWKEGKINGRTTWDPNTGHILPAMELHLWPQPQWGKTEAAERWVLPRPRMQFHKLRSARLSSMVTDVTLFLLHFLHSSLMFSCCFLGKGCVLTTVNFATAHRHKNTFCTFFISKCLDSNEDKTSCVNYIMMI